MQIAFLDSWLQSSAEGSGTAVAIGGLQQALSRRGVEITRIAPKPSRQKSITLQRLAFNAQIPSLLRQKSYDLVIGFDIDGFLWSRWIRQRVPYMVSIKGVLAEEALQEQGQIRRLLWSLSRLERRNVRGAQRVITTSDYCRRAICRHYGIQSELIDLVPEGIDLPRWKRFHQHHANRQNRTILCVARQYPRKHIGDLIQAMVRVRKAIPSARAVIIGDGPEHAHLQQMVANLQLHDSVQLLGAIASDDAVAAAYQQADLFCLPSVQEGFGIAFLEAMASGLPVISTTAAAIPETVPDGEAGVLVAPGDVAALAETLIDLLNDHVKRRQMADFGRAYVERYDWDRVADQFLQVITTQLASHATQRQASQR